MIRQSVGPSESSYLKDLNQKCGERGRKAKVGAADFDRIAVLNFNRHIHFKDSELRSSSTGSGGWQDPIRVVYAYHTAAWLEKTTERNISESWWPCLHFDLMKQNTSEENKLKMRTYGNFFVVSQVMVVPRIRHGWWRRWRRRWRRRSQCCGSCWCWKGGRFTAEAETSMVWGAHAAQLPSLVGRRTSPHIFSPNTGGRQFCWRWLDPDALAVFWTLSFLAVCHSRSLGLSVR